MTRMEHLNRSIAASKSRRLHPINPKPVKHGTRYAYVRHRCRCTSCGAANREYLRERAEQLVAIPPHLHGRPSTYSDLGCRCAACRCAASAYRAQFSREGSRLAKRRRRRREARLRYFRERHRNTKAATA